MKRKLIPICATALMMGGLALTSCGGGKTYEKGVDLNYVLLIGQTDHNDSAARTKGTRDALGTRVDASEQKTNFNLEKAKQGELTLNGKKYRVNELEAAEQRNTSGNAWDQQTATNTAETWINKYASTSWKDGETTKKAQGINLFVSNNDGMAEGAIGATNWPTGMPIFGYDSNESTLKFIKEGKIMGTVNQNASAQAGGILMLTRNLIDKVEKPTVTGFSEEGSWGKLSAPFTLNETDHSFLVDNFAITKENIDDYVNKTPAQLVDKGVKTNAAGATKEIFLNTYNGGDNFLSSTMKPLFEAYKSTLKLNFTIVDGDGNQDSTVLNSIESTPKKEAYVINMITTTTTKSYLDAVASKVGASEAAPTDVPVVFWNRQGTTADGKVDSQSMKDPRFKNIYYVGFDALQGGEVQGQMIVDYLEANIDKLYK